MGYGDALKSLPSKTISAGLSSPKNNEKNKNISQAEYDSAEVEASGPFVYLEQIEHGSAFLDSVQTDDEKTHSEELLADIWSCDRRNAAETIPQHPIYEDSEQNDGMLSHTKQPSGATIAQIGALRDQLDKLLSEEFALAATDSIEEHCVQLFLLTHVHYDHDEAGSFATDLTPFLSSGDSFFYYIIGPPWSESRVSQISGSNYGELYRSISGHVGGVSFRDILSRRTAGLNEGTPSDNQGRAVCFLRTRRAATFDDSPVAHVVTCYLCCEESYR